MTFDGYLLLVRVLDERLELSELISEQLNAIAFAHNPSPSKALVFHPSRPSCEESAPEPPAFPVKGHTLLSDKNKLRS